MARTFDHYPAIRSSRWLATFLLLAAGLLAALLLPAHGTSDMDFYWLHWLQLGRTLGPANAYAAAHSDYPPLTMGMLWLGGILFSSFTDQPIIQIKLTLLLTLVASAGLYWRLSRNALLLSIFLMAHVVGTIGLAYLDIFSGFWIVAGFLLLMRGYPEGFIVSFVCAMLTKWQPLIMAPVVMLFLLQRKNIRHLVALLIMPVVFLFVANRFDVNTVLQAWLKLQRDISGSFFNAYALGMQGLLDAAIRAVAMNNALQQPDTVLALQRFSAIEALNRIGTGSWSSVRFWMSQALFVFFYLYSLRSFVCSRRDMNSLLRCAVQVFIVYFIFRHGVHENHLYTPALLALVLAARDRAYLQDAVVLNLLHNINMIYYFGFDGSWPENSWLSHPNDALTLVLSVFYCFWLLALWKRWMSPAQTINHQPAQINST